LLVLELPPQATMWNKQLPRSMKPTVHLEKAQFSDQRRSCLCN